MGAGTGIGKVRGLGSSKHGGKHWIDQRITAVGNILLTIWFALSLILLPNFEYDTLVAWLSQPMAAVPLMLMLVCIFSHVRLGLQVLIEDYVHDEGLKFGTLILLNFYVVTAAAFGIFSLAKIAFSGAPV
jgi:succinate dehydrogenase / fumarate reductase, membrane anchor subunit